MNNSIYKEIININNEADINRDNKIKNYQQYFKNNFILNSKINYERDIVNKKFLIFLMFIIKELNYRLRTLTNNMYNIF